MRRPAYELSDEALLRELRHKQWRAAYEELRWRGWTPEHLAFWREA